MLPFLLILLATVASALLAFGTSPDWMVYDQGLDVILLTRRLQWSLIVLSVLLCLSLLALVISGRRRAWWLIGLIPVLGLFVHRFGNDPFAPLVILDNPPFVTAERAQFLGDADHVVGLRFGEHDYAFPYDALYMHPVVFQQEHNRRMVLFWNAFADRAQAFVVDRELRARDLEIVSMPANALLLYNAKLGTFVNALTATTPDGAPVPGLRTPLATTRTTWAEWRSRHPRCRVMAAPVPADAPKRPLLPTFPLPPRDLPEDPLARITLLGTEPPLAIPSDRIKTELQHIDSVMPPVVVFRDPTTDEVRAFARTVGETPLGRLAVNTSRHRPTAALFDSNTNTGWTLAGQAVDGPLKDKRLAPVPIEPNLYYGVMQYWYPDLQLLP